MLLYRPYERERAVEYAQRWALGRNRLFGDFSELGGNCTNFVSQCVLAGSCTMNFETPFGWYYLSENHRAPAWTGVDFFFAFLTGEGNYPAKYNRAGPFGRLCRRNEVQLGDVIQYQNEEGKWYHSVLVTGFDGEEILVSAQTRDALHRPLSSYTFADLRFLHLEGVRTSRTCGAFFSRLLEG